ncbi:putative transcriptional regulator protein [Oceanicola granulosus HTCC2516]|uniref:Putative transcriptional regulator protein n=1 Tax=Oceanicola granulosus (strain ATCC BAA-861 / DSM 15982 / KCTC 12143 / HTCC2516) TaxID=314256 RepID=Q2CGS1_OCEGH|nr:FadR/GntR family transcriptional regulator [Oceanicola granulosus]EAR51864.1 putative transcriptional regulator protein [Oceanicola granulosus HTCC2516]
MTESLASPPAAAPTQKPRVHHQIVRALAADILTGKIAPGEGLPREASLCERYGVSRSALREAVKVLVTKGLVTARPRIGTIVQPKDEWNLLDADLLDLSLELAPDPDFVLSLIAARQVIEPAAARFAAARAGPEDIARLEAAYADMARHLEARAFQEFNAADIQFHRALLKASRNVVFQQLSNTIGAALGYSFKLTTSRSQDPGGSLGLHGEVLEHIRNRDPLAAQTTMARLLDIAVMDLGVGSAV